MSSGGSAYVVVGFEVKRAHFFEEIGKTKQCPKGHEAPEGVGKFCADCGGKFSVKPVEKPTEAFEKVAKEVGKVKSAQAYWDALQDGIDLKGNDRGKRFGIFEVGETVTSADDTHKLAIGFRLMEAGSERTDGRVLSLPVDDLQKWIAATHELAADLEVKDAKIAIFLTFYWSI